MTHDLNYHELAELANDLRDERDAAQARLAAARETIARVRRYCQARNNPSVNVATHQACNDVLKILGEE